jgi:predicted nucleotidyltransferase
MGTALFGRTRRRVLALFFTRPDETFYQRQIVARVKGGVGGVQRELSRLARAGILRRERRGNQVAYQADPACPIFAELRSLAVKTVGVGDVLREALASLKAKIPIAFVFGSFARNEHHGGSDVDVMVIADEVSFGDVVAALKPAETTLGREVNPTLYRRNELGEKIAAGHHFLLSVLRAERIWLIGSEDELKRITPMAAMGLAQGARHEQAGSESTDRAGGA